jgi:hypothetical protein
MATIGAARLRQRRAGNGHAGDIEAWHTTLRNGRLAKRARNRIIGLQKFVEQLGAEMPPLS